LSDQDSITQDKHKPRENALTPAIVPITEMDILTPAPMQKIGDTSFTKKSGWMKMALACNISTEKREERVEKDGDETIYHYTYRAIAPSGRFADADASASSGERNYTHLPHDLRALAQTRACSRAISNLVGGGEVSFEEMASSGSASSTPKPEEKNSLAEVVLRKGQTWDKIFKKFGPEIQTRQEELGPLFSFEQAAIVFVQEKGFVQELPR